MYPTEYHVCKNIINFCKFRGMELDRNYELKADGRAIVMEEPIMFFPTKNGVKYQIIYIPANSDKYKKNNFNRIAQPEYEIIVVKDPSKKIKYLEKPITEYPIGAFLRNHPKAWKVKGQECKILTEDEVNNYLNIHKMLVTSFPKLHPSSVEAIWYGLQEGNVVELTSMSISSAGVACSLRRVSKTGKVSIEPAFEDED